MLYVTTRNNRDAFTAQWALREKRNGDGGKYLPLRAPRFSDTEIAALGEKSFSQNVADILNLLFHTKLSSWDVDFCIGRYPVRITTLRHRILVAESWHNPDWDYEWVVNNLVSHLCDETVVPGNWVRIAVRIAILFGIYGELQKQGIETADISVLSGDFSAPISAWYARQWGLPVKNIICSCNENKSLWDLLCQGQLRTDQLSIPTIIAKADVVIPSDLERLIYECGKIPEVERYLTACRQGVTYFPADMVLAKMREGMFVSVVSSNRITATIPGVYGTNHYLLSPESALTYAGLLDYRAKMGETGHAVILSETSPQQNVAFLAKAINLPEDILKDRIHQGRFA